MAVDYRELNKNLRPSTFPLPHVKDSIEKLSSKKYFTALDITSAFNQLKLAEETKRSVGFVTLGRRFITNRMPFSAKQSPGIFQQYIRRALKKISEEYCTIYINDIVITSES